MSTPCPADEAARLRALQRYDILDTLPEAAFDDLTRLAGRICGTPIALVSLVDANRQWFKSHYGLDVLETPRDGTFCAHGIMQHDVLIVPDARADARFATSPLVTHDPQIRFYAGVPLVTPDGYALGMLCVKDHVPRELAPGQIEALCALGRLTMAQLQLRQALATMTEAEQVRTRAERQNTLELLQSAFEALPDGILVTDSAGQISSYNRPFVDLWHIPESLLAADDAAPVIAWVQAQLATPDPLLAQVQVLDIDPEATNYNLLTLRDGRVIERHAQPHRFIGVLIGHVWSFREITDSVKTERALVDTERHLHDILTSLTDVVWSVDLATGQNRYVSPSIEPLSGIPVHEFEAHPECWITLVHPEDRAAFTAYSATLEATGRGEIEYRIIRPDGQVRWVLSRDAIVRNEHNIPVRLDGIVSDITARKQMEAERTRLQADVIRMQEVLLAELSTPVIPLSDRVLVAPVVGSVDSRRAQQLMETLLRGCAEHSAEVVIVDVTGVAVVDTQVANTVVQVAQTLRLLGAQVVLTGVRPEIAQTLVGLDVDLRGVTTRSTLQSGIAAALAQRVQ
jgi:PAS domain S-box-containing protein